ncbi:MAG: D-glycero-beta-D-manno-heptose 1,7-bisphosphate 7-phosphatase [Tatlockia sp.]|nr:D-glycero-beta-D-manno-heptose 1,7-bisphosphate 7-phosphatase [Tatlockia sp.]
MNKIILLDRDGVINQDSFNYIKSVDEFIPIAGSIDAIARLTRAGYQIGVATNQSGIARGYYSEQVLTAIHAKMLGLVEEAGGEIQAIEYCKHMPDAGCSCRKPQPGMLLTLAERLNCSLTGVSFVGDRITDIDAAVAVGAKPVIVLSQMTDRLSLEARPKVPVFNSLALYIDELLASN